MTLETVSSYWFLIYIAIPMLITCIINTYLLRYEEYNYNNSKISVYAGWENYILFVDDGCIAKEETMLSYKDICLSKIYQDNFYEVIIKPSSKIILKINGEIIELNK